MKDLHSKVSTPANGIAIATHNATVNGTGVDLQDFESAECIVMVGTITDGTHTFKLQESSDNATFTDVAATDQIGMFAAPASDTHQRVGYIGSQRYIRPVSTVVAGVTGGVYGLAIMKGGARHQPVS